MAVKQTRWAGKGSGAITDHTCSQTRPPRLIPTPQTDGDAGPVGIHSGAPPIVASVTAAETSANAPCKNLPSTIVRIDATDSAEANARQKSAGWIGSITLHAIFLLIIAMLLSPKDFSGDTMQTLVLTLADTVAPPPSLMLLDNSPQQDTSEEDLELLQPVPIVPVKIATNLGLNSQRSGGRADQAGRSSGNAAGGARGSFFGIEAVGHKFVYIVDRSGSMRHGRYRRAIDEMLRSVNELRDDQKFMVVLFSSSSMIMFDQSHFSAAMVAATQENKMRLQRWVSNVGPGGGTYPNESLKIALKQRPSAIFMLSDGEFNRGRRGRGNTPWGDEGDAYSIVERFGDVTPIHSIAFEDPQSCANMERLATLSGGDYRFVPAENSAVEQLATELKTFLASPLEEQTPAKLDALCRQIEDPRVNASVNQHDRLAFAECVQQHFRRTEPLTQQGPTGAKTRLQHAFNLLRRLVAMDPAYEACASPIDDALCRITEYLNLGVKTETTQSICDEVVSWTNSPATLVVLDGLAPHYAALTGGDPNDVFRRCRLMERLHPDSMAVQACQAASEAVARRAMKGYERLRDQNRLAEAIAALRTLHSRSGAETIKRLSKEELVAVTTDQLVAIRSASLEDRDADKAVLEQQLQQGYGDDPLLPELRSEFTRAELAARRSLRNIQRRTQSSSLEDQRAMLQGLIEQYPKSFAARRAAELLDALPQETAVSLPEGSSPWQAELIRKLDMTRQ